jgi:hypothetical protein
MGEPIIRKLYPNNDKQWCAICKSTIVGAECYSITIPIGSSAATAQFSFCARCFTDNKLEITALEDYTSYSLRVLRVVAGNK